MFAIAHEEGSRIIRSDTGEIYCFMGGDVRDRENYILLVHGLNMKSVTDLTDLELNALVTDLVAQKDNAYSQRNINAAVMAKMAIALGLKAGRWFHEGEEEGWGWFISVELPTGWVDWHVPNHEIQLFKDLPIVEREWEDYTDEEKVQRLLAAEFYSSEEMVE